MYENRDNFMKEYKNKRRYLDSVFNQIPIYIVKKGEVGLDGAVVKLF